VESELIAQCHDPNDLRAANLEHRVFQLAAKLGLA
jgi:hypothetical protein